MEEITKAKTTLGANYNKETNSVDFKLYSKNATKVFLCIFDAPKDEEAVMTLEMKKEEKDIWHTSVKDYILDCKNRPVYYGFRVFGPNWEYEEDFVPNSSAGFKSKVDTNSNRFCPNKIAYDPYTKELSHLASEVNLGLNMFRSGANYHLINNAKWAPKSVYRYVEDKKIAKASIRPFNQEIIAEVHIKDLTQTLSMPEKGTYKGAKLFANSLKKLGVTMVEFLPLNEFDHKQNDGNYWGYMPLGYFSLAKKYAFNKEAGKILEEFREMVDEFHKNDIKVCLDMVYNHTGEAGLINHDTQDATLMSYSLIDNSSYYKTFPNGYYRSNSGCGNDFNISNEGVMNLVIDSLEYWINQGVDAFRFDLAAALLECSSDCKEIYDSFNSLAANLKEELKKRNINVVDDFTKAQDGVVLIAEPWTCGGSNCYQLGKFPSFWAEWNDITRDTIRKITLRPKETTPYMLKDLLEGTPSRFLGVSKSINYIASHDGFTIYDLNTFKKKSASTQGGSDWEISGDYEGNLEKRENAIRKQLALLFLSYGIPMIQVGDIIMHTKSGNNNSYNKDSAINYLNWQKATTKNTFENRIMEYIRNLIDFRKTNPIFKKEYFKNIKYFYNDATEAKENNDGYWKNPLDLFFGALIEDEESVFVASTKSDFRYSFSLPKPKEGKSWHKCLDTSDFFNLELSPKEYIEKDYILNPNSLVVFMEK